METTQSSQSDGICSSIVMSSPIYVGEKDLRCGSIMSMIGLEPTAAAAPRVRTPDSAASITPFSSGTLSLVLL